MPSRVRTFDFGAVVSPQIGNRNLVTRNVVLCRVVRTDRISCSLGQSPLAIGDIVELPSSTVQRHWSQHKPNKRVSVLVCAHLRIQCAFWLFCLHCLATWSRFRFLFFILICNNDSMSILSSQSLRVNNSQIAGTLITAPYVARYG
jgi:hypothetical protein